MDRSGTIDIRDLAEGVRQSDCTSQQPVAMSGETIGRALAAAVNVLNPALIVAGCCVPQLGNFLA